MGDKTTTIEQIQAWWDRWQEAPEWARFCWIDAGGNINWSPDDLGCCDKATLEPRPPAAIGVLLGVIEQKDHQIDWLMVEHCPDEMTGEQWVRFQKHQVPCTEDEMNGIKAAIAGEQE